MRSIINNTKQTLTIFVVTAAFLSLVAGSAVAGHLITGKDVKNSSLTGADVKNSSLTGGDVKNSSLTGGDIKNGSVGPSDLNAAAKATLQGPKGDPGTHGPIGTAYNASLRQRTETTFATVPGSTANITLPQGASKLLITYSGECAAADPASPSAMEVRFQINGQNLGQQVTFCRNDADEPSSDRRDARSIQIPSEMPPGDYAVSVQWRSTTAAGTVWLDDTTLSVITG